MAAPLPISRRSLRWPRIAPMACALLVVSMVGGCRHERTPADVVTEHRDALEQRLARIERIDTLLQTLPPLRGSDMEVGERPVPRFQAAGALPANALLVPLSVLHDPARPGSDPLDVGSRTALSNVAAWLETGADLAGTTDVTTQRVDGWFREVLALRYVAVLRVTRFEKPSMIMESLVPGLVEGEVVLFDLPEARPLGGYSFTARSEPGTTGSERALVAALKVQGRAAIEAGWSQLLGPPGPLAGLPDS